MGNSIFSFGFACVSEDILPSVIVAGTLIRFCYPDHANQSIQNKKLPFILTTIIFLLPLWAVEVLYCIIQNGLHFVWSHDLFFVFLIIMEMRFAAILLV